MTRQAECEEPRFPEKEFVTEFNWKTKLEKPSALPTASQLARYFARWGWERALKAAEAGGEREMTLMAAQSRIAIKDFPKLESPFVRTGKEWLVTPKIAEGYEWVFSDDAVIATEKLHGACVSVIVQEGQVVSQWNRARRVPFINRGKAWITEGVLEAYARGYLDLPDGQYFGELVGPCVNGNPYKLERHLWVPFETYAKEHLAYKSWGKYPKTYESISEWFKTLAPFFAMKRGDKEGFVEGVVFHHPDGRMAKLRKDMFDWFKGPRHKEASA